MNLVYLLIHYIFLNIYSNETIDFKLSVSVATQACKEIHQNESEEKLKDCILRLSKSAYLKEIENQSSDDRQWKTEKE